MPAEEHELRVTVGMGEGGVSAEGFSDSLSDLQCRNAIVQE